MAFHRFYNLRRHVTVVHRDTQAFPPVRRVAMLGELKQEQQQQEQDQQFQQMQQTVVQQQEPVKPLTVVPLGPTVSSVMYNRVFH